MERGYVKIYRKSLDARVFNNEGLWKLWTWCLLRAGHEERWVTVKIGANITEVHLKPGQFIFGRHSAAKELRMNPNTVWKRILKLKKMENLNIRSNNHYSIITIVNWGLYQDRDNKSNSESNSRVTAGYQPGNTNKNVKNVKNEIYSRVITYLNKKTDSKYRATSKKTRSLIKNRMKEGFAVEDFKTVIDDRCHKWMNDTKMQDYLRP